MDVGAKTRRLPVMTLRCVSPAAGDGPGTPKVAFRRATARRSLLDALRFPARDQRILTGTIRCLGTSVNLSAGNGAVRSPTAHLPAAGQSASMVPRQPATRQRHAYLRVIAAVRRRRRDLVAGIGLGLIRGRFGAWLLLAQLVRLSLFDVHRRACSPLSQAIRAGCDIFRRCLRWRSRLLYSASAPEFSPAGTPRSAARMARGPCLISFIRSTTVDKDADTFRQVRREAR